MTHAVNRPTPAYRIPTAALAGPDGPAPRPVPQPDPDDRLIPWERALDMIKNVMVIVTCAVVLYGAWRLYLAVGVLQAALEDLQRMWGA